MGQSRHPMKEGSDCCLVMRPKLQNRIDCRSTTRQRVDEFSRLDHQPKSHLPTICNPTSPTCSNSVLPVHTTSHRTESAGSSKTSSTSCPRLSLKLPRNLNPSWDLSTIRQGNIFWTPLRVMTRLARFFVTMRLDRRRPWIGELGIDLSLASVYGLR